MSNLQVSKLVTYSCDNGGTITISRAFSDLHNTGVDEFGAYFGDVSINAYTDLILDVGSHDTTATLTDTVDEDVLNFKVSATDQSGKADIHFSGLKNNSWHRLLFNGVLGRTNAGTTHGKSSTDGKLTFRKVRIPNE